jgi:hypothetical protein
VGAPSEPKFWHRFEARDSGDRQEDLQGYVRERLLLALEFATLGAYELASSERDAAGAAEDLDHDTPTHVDACDRSHRAHASARVSARCDADSSHRSCAPPATWQAPIASRHVRPAAPKLGHSAPRRRIGQARAAEQLCVWVGILANG